MQRKAEKARTKTQGSEATGILLTMREASRLLHVHENTLRRWSNWGILRTYRVGPGHQRRYKAQDIAAFLVEDAERRRAKQVP